MKEFQETEIRGENQADILHQIVEVFGKSGSYIWTQRGDANKAMVDQFSTEAFEAIDGVINHYLYT